MNDNRKAETVRSIDSVLRHAHERRVALGLVDMPEYEAQIRIRAIDKMSSQQILDLLALPPEPRESQLRAMEADQRHRHSLWDLPAVARSEIDERPLYRWWCACGDEAPGDYFSGSAARGAWETHAGIAQGPQPVPEAPDRRLCAWVDCARGAGGSRRWFKIREERQSQRYCCVACRDADPGRQRPRIESTED